MALNKGIVDKIKSTDTVIEDFGGPGEGGYVSLDSSRYPIGVVAPVIEQMTGSRIRYPGDVALGVKSISHFYKKLSEVSQIGEGKTDYKPYKLKDEEKPEKKDPVRWIV